jgi:hypothetical protein
MMLTLVVAIPLTFHDNLDDIAWMTRMLRCLNSQDEIIKRMLNEQARKGVDKSQQVKHQKLIKYEVIRDFMKRRPHSPIIRFLRVGAAP